MTLKTTQLEMELKGLDRKENKSVVVLTSSGVDSTAVCKKMKELGYMVYGLFIDYGQMASDAEWNTLKKQKSLGIIDGLDTITLELPLWVVPHKAETDFEGWIPGRNTLFMVLAGIKALQLDADGIAIGFAKMDCGVFGDNNYVHHRVVESLLSLSLSRPIKVFTPIMNMDKKELLEYVKDIPTVSCWFATFDKTGKISVCGKCPNCRERMRYETM